MSLATVTPADALGGKEGEGYDTVIDVRSPSEFAEDRLPGAVNWPVLNDEERAEVGTIYTQVSTFEARKRGAAIVSRNIARIIDEQVIGQPREWRPLVYCWRGGQRSGSLSIVLAQIGFRTRQLQGGYKAFRALVRDELATLPARFDWRVVGGRTGSGKTRLLQALSTEGAQVLDLERLALHRGSVLGDLPGQPQPTQKHFETAIWQVLRGFDPARPLFAERESRRIGKLQLPDGVLDALRDSARPLLVELPLAERVKLLAEDYAFLMQDVDLLCSRLQTLVELRGKTSIARWQALARAGDWSTLLDELLTQHYDPLYDHGLRARSGAAVQELSLADATPATLVAAARSLQTSDRFVRDGADPGSSD